MRPGRAAVVLSACAALGCGPVPGPAPTRPEPPVGQIKQYQPLEMARDARQPGLAVILGTDGANGSTVLTLPVGATIAVVDAMTVSHAGAAPLGAIQPIVLTSASRSPGSARLASPVQVGGADDATPAAARWRAGVWSAARVAAGALGKDLGDVALEVTPAGSIEGTVSALVAAGFVAALTGATIDPAATLAGAIEPDGTIGPAAGLPEQLAAALARGKTRIGIPAGMRIARSAAGKDVDLVQLARAHRAEAIELADVHDAYLLLTHRRLPAPVPAAEARMALDADTLARLDAGYAAWRERLAGEWAPLLQLEQAGWMPAALLRLVQAAHRHGERAEALHRAGKLAAAHGEIRIAWRTAAAANQCHAVLGKLAAGDAAGAVAALTALDPGDAGLRAVFARIGEHPPATIADHLAMLDALEAGLRAWAYHELAADAVRAAAQLIGELPARPPAERSAPAVVEAASAVVAPAVLRLLDAAAEVTAAEEALGLAAAPGPACMCPPANLAAMAAVLEAAAAASAGHITALVVEPLARNLGLPDDAARRRAAALEPDAAIADLPRSAADGLPHEIAAAWGDGSPAAALLALAGARAAVSSAARLIAAHDALGVHRDDAGRIDAVNHPEAFRRLLAAAERTARAAAHAAQIASGAVPVQARLAYQRATLAAGGGLADQLDALAELWRATALSETAVALARNCN